MMVLVIDEKSGCQLAEMELETTRRARYDETLNPCLAKAPQEYRHRCVIALGGCVTAPNARRNVPKCQR